MGISVGKPDRSFWLSTTAITPLALLIPSLAFAQVVTDGTTGPGGALTGPDYEITADLGTRAGDNLFHSFEEFSIDTGESATFSGPDEIANVVSRVTGETPSDIDGTLRSTMPEADFYFINPNGVTFGPNATLDVQGSFHVSTADELRFEGGEAFSAIDPDASGFAVAEPRAFGFFDAEPGAILVDGSQLTVGSGESMSLVGGDIIILGREDPDALQFVFPPGGNLNLVATKGNGEVEFSDGLVTGTTTDNAGTLLLDREAVVTNSSILEDAGGTIFVRAGGVGLFGGSTLAADNFTDLEGVGGIDLEADILVIDQSSMQTNVRGGASGGAITLKVGTLAVINDGRIRADVRGDGQGGDITIEADGNIFVEDGGSITANILDQGSGGLISISSDQGTLFIRFGGLISSTSISDSPAGGIDLSFSNGDVILDERGRILSITNGSADASDVRIQANRLLAIDLAFDENSVTGISTQSFGSGDSGDLDIDTQQIFLIGGRVSADSSGSGVAGTIDVNTGELTIGAFPSRITSNSVGNLGSTAGAIKITAGRITIYNLGLIATGTLGNGSGGSIDIDADSIFLSGGGIVSSVGFGQNEDIEPSLPNDGKERRGGDIRIRTNSLEMELGGSIVAGTFGPTDSGNIEIVVEGGDALLSDGGITATTVGSGNAGSVDLQILGGDLVMVDDSLITSRTVGGSGEGGDLTISAENIRVLEQSTIETDAEGGGSAGAVTVSAANELLIRQRSEVSSSATEAQAGTVNLSGRDIHIEDSRVSTEANEQTGGEITISAEDTFVSTNSEITSNGIIPEAGTSIITISSPLIALNESRVSSLTAQGEPVTGAGEASLLGDTTLISTDSTVEASSSVAISGLLNDFSNQLIILDSQFADASRLLRENCESGGDLGGSTFVTSGRSPSIAPDGGLLPGFYSEALPADEVRAGNGEPVVIVAPCP